MGVLKGNYCLQKCSDVPDIRKSEMLTHNNILFTLQMSGASTLRAEDSVTVRFGFLCQLTCLVQVI